MTSFLPNRWIVRLALALWLGACVEKRPAPAPTPNYEDTIGPLLAEHCKPCHLPVQADAGRDAQANASLAYRVDGYEAVLDCVGGDPTRPALVVGDAGSPLLQVLEREDHAQLLSGQERATLQAWVEADAPRTPNRVHKTGIANPHSADFHGRLAAQDRYGPLRSPGHPEACGRCHRGAPVAPAKARPLAGAPPCTQCHNEPEGVLACGTCHGDGAARAYPPRDRCRFGGSEHDAHQAHLTRRTLSKTEFDCDSCHPAADGALDGKHANRRVDVEIDRGLAGAELPDGGRPLFDADTGRCSVGCHSRGGDRAQPRFDEAGPLGCGDCHGAPPPDHYAGTCDGCHSEANASGTAVRGARLHLNGQVDVGRPEAEHLCAGCHGSDSMGSPDSGAHALHLNPSICQPIPCSECHRVPQAVTSEGHLDRSELTPADVDFGPLARARGQRPGYEDGTCRQVACHGAGLGEGIERALHWDDRPSGRCAGCHGLPPGGGHPDQDSCAATGCHGNLVTAEQPPALTDTGVIQHIDGTVDY